MRFHKTSRLNIAFYKSEVTDNSLHLPVSISMNFWLKNAFLYETQFNIGCFNNEVIGIHYLNCL